MRGKPFTDADLATLKRLRAAGVPGREIAQQMSRPHTTIEFQVKRHQLPLPPKPALVIPNDFREQWYVKSMLQLASHYNVSEHVIKKIVRKLGLKRAKIGLNLTTPSQRRAIEMPPNRYITAARPIANKAVMNEAGRAAEYLKPDYVPVYRCDENGNPNPSGRWWRCGTRTFDDKMIIERAAEVKARRARMRGVAA